MIDLKQSIRHVLCLLALMFTAPSPASDAPNNAVWEVVGSSAPAMLPFSPASNSLSAEEDFGLTSSATSYDLFDRVVDLSVSLDSARHEVNRATAIVSKLEPCLFDAAVKSYVHELGIILGDVNLAAGDLHSLSNAAGDLHSLSKRLKGARIQLSESTGSGALWLAVARIVSPNNGPYRLPGRLVRVRKMVEDDLIDIESIDDSLIAQDAFV